MAIPTRAVRRLDHSFRVRTLLTRKMRRSCRWSWRFSPTAGRSWTTGMPAALSRAPLPTPLTCMRCGEPIAPAASTTSRRARKVTSSPPHPGIDPGRAPPFVPGLNRDPFRTGMGDDVEVGPPPDRTEERARGVPAHSAPLVHLEVARALIVAAVEVVDLPDPDLRRRLPERAEQLPGDPRVLDPPLSPPAPVQLVAAVHVILGALEIGQHVFPAPSRVPELAPLVVVAGLAAHVDHPVDGRAAPEPEPPGVGEGAPVEPRFRLGLEAPVGAGVVHGVEVADRDADPEVVVLASGLEQRDPHPGVRGEPVGRATHPAEPAPTIT